MMKSLLFILFVNFLFCYGVEKLDDRKTFLYFAYGSNLLERRLRIHNKSARFFSVAKLMGHRLDFNMCTLSWNGAVATMAVDEDTHVWGALWVIDIKDMKQLDDQEGVNTGRYYPKNVTVNTRDGQNYVARTYLETVPPPKVPSNELPPERQPSITYMEVIIYGAFECMLPLYYIKFLFTFPTNGKYAVWNLRQELGRPFNETELYSTD